MNFNPVFLSELVTSAGTPKKLGQKMKSPSYLFSDIINVIKDDVPKSQEAGLAGLFDIVNSDVLGNSNGTILFPEVNSKLVEGQNVQNKNLVSILNLIKTNLVNLPTSKKTAKTNQLDINKEIKNLFEYQNVDEENLTGLLKEILSKVDNVEIEVDSDKLENQNLKIEKNKTQKININDLLKYIFQQISQNNEVKINLFAGKDKIEIDLSKTDLLNKKSISGLSNENLNTENSSAGTELQKDQINENILLNKVEKILNSENNIVADELRNIKVKIDESSGNIKLPGDLNQLNENKNVSEGNSKLSISNQSLEIKDQIDISNQNTKIPAAINLDDKNIELVTDKSSLTELESKLISELKNQKPAETYSGKSQITADDKPENSTDTRQNNENAINPNLKNEIENILNKDLQNGDLLKNRSNIQRSEVKQTIVNKNSVKVDNNIQQNPDEEVTTDQSKVDSKNDKTDYNIKINIEPSKNKIPKSFFEEIEFLNDQKPDLRLNKPDKLFNSSKELLNSKKSISSDSSNEEKNINRNSKNDVDVTFKAAKKIIDQNVKEHQDINTNKAGDLSNKINVTSFNDNELLENVAGLSLSKLNDKNNLEINDHDKNFEKSSAKVKSLSNPDKKVENKLSTEKDFNNAPDKRESNNPDQMDIKNAENDSKVINNITKGIDNKILNNTLIKTASIVNNTLKELLNSANIKNYSRIDGDNKSKSITMRLSPEHLGKVKVALDVQNNSVKANIEVEDQTVKNIIQNNISQLRQSIANQGLMLSSLNISLSNQETKQNKSYQTKKKTHSNFKIDNMINQEILSTPKSLGYNTYEYLI